MLARHRDGVAALLCSFPGIAGDPDQDAYSFVDLPAVYQQDYPDWLKASFYNLPEDLDDALASKKQGLIGYFGQKLCPYCQALLRDNLSKGDLVHYLRSHFDVVGLKIPTASKRSLAWME